MPRADLMQELRACCGSGRWVVEMAERRPFFKADALFDAASRSDAALGPDDWLEAFSQHPRVGDVESLRQRFGDASGGWSEDEQKGLADAPDDVMERLAKANQTYEERFGYVFIICATDKSAAEILYALEGRLDNDPAAELEIAAEEQRKITQLRLEKLLADD